MDIIPRKKEKLFRWQETLFYSLIGLFLLMILIFSVLSYFQKQSLTELRDMEQLLTAQKTLQKIALEKEILNEQKKINDFSLLLGNHLIATNFFAFLEKTSHPKIRYSQVSLNPLEGQAMVSGYSDSFSSLGQQFQILNQEPSVQKANLSKISLEKKGEISFTFDFSLEPNLFK